MRRAATVALAVVVAAVVAAPAAPAKEATTSTLPLAALRAVLKARTDAQTNKDRAAYAATIDPQAPASFHDAQMRGYDGLASLPVASINYKIDPDDAEVDLTRGVDPKKYGDAPVALVAT